MRLATVVKAKVVSGWADRSERFYLIVLVRSVASAVQTPKHSVIIPITGFPNPPTIRPDNIKSRIPPFMHEDGTELIGWLRENLRGKCDIVARYIETGDRNRFNERILRPVLSCNFTDTTDAVNAKLRFC